MFPGLQMCRKDFRVLMRVLPFSDRRTVKFAHWTIFDRIVSFGRQIVRCIIQAALIWRPILQTLILYSIFHCSYCELRSNLMKTDHKIAMRNLCSAVFYCVLLDILSLIWLTVNQDGVVRPWFPSNLDEFALRAFEENEIMI